MSVHTNPDDFLLSEEEPQEDESSLSGDIGSLGESESFIYDLSEDGFVEPNYKEPSDIVSYLFTSIFTPLSVRQAVRDPRCRMTLFPRIAIELLPFRSRIPPELLGHHARKTRNPNADRLSIRCWPAANRRRKEILLSPLSIMETR